MRTQLDCIPCIVRQALEAARLATTDADVHEQVIREVLRVAAEMDLGTKPPKVAQWIHWYLRECVQDEDPYRDVKKRFNEMALNLAPSLRERIAKADDPQAMATRLAIAGNVIDFGVNAQLSEADVHAAIDAALRVPLDGNVVEFWEAISSAASILYLTDNAGEIVFDRLLLELMPREKVTVAVRGAPVINDATREDAEAAGILELAAVIDNGSDAPGTILEDCSEEFRACFDAADLVISKGQGNFETLNDVDRNVYFLLKAKCPMVAGKLGCELGSLVMKHASCWNSDAAPSASMATD